MFLSDVDIRKQIQLGQIKFSPFENKFLSGIYEMTNISNLPIKLYVGMRVAQMAFIPVSTPVKTRRD